MLFNKATITNAGLQAIALTEMLGTPLVLTQCKLSSHNYSSLTIAQLKELTDIEDIKQTQNITEKTIKNNTTIKISSNFVNDTLIEGYDLYSYGVFAQYTIDGTTSTILFAIGVADIPDPVPSVSEGQWQTIINSEIAVSDTSNITINIDYAAIATQQWVLDHLPPQHEFIITMPTDTTQYETITDAASKTYYKYTYTNAEVKNKYSERDIYLGNETLLDTIDNMEDGYSSVIKVVCLNGSIEVYIKEIPTNTFYIKVAQ